MKIYKKILSVILLLNSYIISHTFVTNSNFVITKEQQNYNNILEIQKLPCHLQSVRVKSFESSLQKMKRIDIENVYDIYDLIGFRFVFYTKEDLLKFYHHLKLEKTIMYTNNYISKPKSNGYSAMHIRYRNEHTICPIKQMECQLYTINDYYNSIYGNAKYYKNYTKYF